MQENSLFSKLSTPQWDLGSFAPDVTGRGGKLNIPSI